MRIHALLTIAFLAVATLILAIPTVTSGAHGVLNWPFQRGYLLGQATLGPICPTVTFPPTENCNDRPFQAVIIIKSTDSSKEVARVKSKKNGWFRAYLPAGTYKLVPKSPNSANPEPSGDIIPLETWPLAASQTVEIKPGKVTQVGIWFDSGIR